MHGRILQLISTQLSESPLELVLQGGVLPSHPRQLRLKDLGTHIKGSASARYERHLLLSVAVDLEILSLLRLDGLCLVRDPPHVAVKLRPAETVLLRQNVNGGLHV